MCGEVSPAEMLEQETGNGRLGYLIPGRHGGRQLEAEVQWRAAIVRGSHLSRFDAASYDIKWAQEQSIVSDAEQNGCKSVPACRSSSVPITV